MAQLFGVCLLPATGEFTYDTFPAQGKKATESSFSPINTHLAPTGTKTDYSYALDQLQAAHPECQTVALVCAWFGNSTDAATCKIYPSTNFIGGAFETYANGAWTAANWKVSGLTQNSAGLIPISTNNGAATYGGAPSDQSIVRCIRDLRARGLRVIFYPFILMDTAGKPWRGRIGLATDLTAATTQNVNSFLGGATPSQFTRDAVNLTVAYSGSPTDFTYRRFILHYANLCALAGGVDLFLLGSELRGLEILRGPNWTQAGTTDVNGHAQWDYPFVAGLVQLAADVRATFDAAGFARDLTNHKNLIAYSPDWSSWNGWQHPGANGQWPHLDSLFASQNIDVVSFDNYLPLSDWTLGDGGLDCKNWNAPAPQTWPPGPETMNGLGLSGQPSLQNADYLKANIEGGEGFNWFYTNSLGGGVGLDPLGTDQRCTLPLGDRVTQTRHAFAANQQLLTRKGLRWWWNNTHRAIYDNGDGTGWSPHGPTTAWTPQSKPIAFVEYGFATVDRCTNQPNVFYDPKSSESATPFWSLWTGSVGSGWRPQRDDTLADLALQSVHDYWSANNATSGSGVAMVFTPFCCAWNCDARPFPVFPLDGDVWGDGGAWATGNWIGGKGPATAPTAPDPSPTVGTFATFPTLAGQGWSVKFQPRFLTCVQAHVSGRESRAARRLNPLHDIELNFDLLRGAAAHAELQEVVAFIANHAGQSQAFLFTPPNALGVVVGEPIGVGDGTTTSFALTQKIGGFSENVQALLGAPTVYLDGVAAPPTAYALSILPAVVTFTSAPASGVVVTADFTAAHLARFADDSLDLEEFMTEFWTLKSLKLETVRT
ncbi:hypothetical protein CCR94_21545 [Rhodoblastus sphagnicola]|uniref:Uncharacterized protein n=1 Tax=Rhodoblastus sphagnicola TaxID=333368 RepID=A0A2S6MWW4_9HYPH|nr:glycoside hydrolase TIM-barrel-like domain-containing protein [Rhodoblastus sphagnicola]MBB4200687.1 uncharacterized protein (TIGR02217 family) [Rhodoblastus sphagnicola]PPQ26850.1 hypothetical protein CCR94_21545 [Rhodoblastus sphagnicola]